MWARKSADGKPKAAAKKSSCRASSAMAARLTTCRILMTTCESAYAATSAISPPERENSTMRQLFRGCLLFCQQQFFYDRHRERPFIQRPIMEFHQAEFATFGLLILLSQIPPLAGTD